MPDITISIILKLANASDYLREIILDYLCVGPMSKHFVVFKYKIDNIMASTPVKCQR